MMRFAGGPDEGEPASLRSLLAGDRAFLEHGVCLWPVVLRDSGEVIGCCGFHVGEEPRVLELAYHFKSRHWGHGYATEAASAALEYAFEVWGARHVVAWVFPENVASWKVLEKLGFVHERFDQGEKVYRLVR